MAICIGISRRVYRKEGSGHICSCGNRRAHIYRLHVPAYSDQLYVCMCVCMCALISSVFVLCNIVIGHSTTDIAGMAAQALRVKWKALHFIFTGSEHSSAKRPCISYSPAVSIAQPTITRIAMASVANRVLYMNKFLWCEECGVPKERVRFEVYDLGYDICQECVSRLYGGDGGGGDASGGDGSGAGTTGGGGASGSATTGHSSERRGPRVRKCVQKKPAAGPRVRSS